MGPQFNHSSIQQFNNLTVPLFNNPTIQQSNNPTIQRLNNSTIQQFNNSTIQQFNNSTFQQFNNLQFKPKNSSIGPKKLVLCWLSLAQLSPLLFSYLSLGFGGFLLTSLMQNSIVRFGEDQPM